MKHAAPLACALSILLSACGGWEGPPPGYASASYGAASYSSGVPQAQVTAYAAPAPDPAAAPLSMETIYGELAPYGTFLDDAALGVVFLPADPDYIPYADGHWEYTEQGFTWVSHDEIGWLVCHYGRWVWRDRWMWVPGTAWGPAWVDWRESGSVVGWAPMPPEGWVEPWPMDLWVFVSITNVFVEEIHEHYWAPGSVGGVWSTTAAVPRDGYGGYCPGPAPSRLRRRGVQVRITRPHPGRIGRVAARPDHGLRPPIARRNATRAADRARRLDRARRSGAAAQRHAEDGAAWRSAARRIPSEEARRRALGDQHQQEVGAVRLSDGTGRRADTGAGRGAWEARRAAAAEARLRAREDARLGLELERRRAAEATRRESLARAERHGAEATRRATFDQAQREAAQQAQQRAAFDQAQRRAAEDARQRAAFDQTQRQAAQQAQQRAAMQQQAQQRAAMQQQAQQRAAMQQQAQQRAVQQAQQRAAQQAAMQQQAQQRAAQQAAMQQQAQQRAARQAAMQQQAQQRAAQQAQQRAAQQAQQRAAQQAQQRAAQQAQQRAAEEARRRAAEGARRHPPRPGGR